MTTAREIMHAGVETVTTDTTLTEAARRMRDRDIGALPVCNEDGRPVGMVTDRDIIVKCLAAEQDPTRTRAGELAGRELFTVGEDTDMSEVLALMESRQIRRLPVLDTIGRLVGIITEGDIARGLPEQQIGEFVEAVCGSA